MGLDCHARIIIGIPVDRQDFYTLEDTGIYTCPSGHDFEKKMKYCHECGKPLDAITKRVFTDDFLSYCKSLKKSPDKVMRAWEDNWDDPVMRIHNADEIAWTSAEIENEVLGIRILETQSHRDGGGGRVYLGQAAIDDAFKEMRKLGKHFYSEFDVDLYLSLSVSG